MEQRTCKCCGIEQDVELFPLAGIVKGKTYRRYKCNACYVDMKRKRKQKIRNEIKEYKQTLQCAKCGISDHRVLQFHHHEANKEFNISDAPGRGMSVKNIIKEIEKCQVLCANCHSILHYEERE